MTSLEDIVKTYGMNDYLDISTGMVYKLSKVIDAGNNEYKVPVVSFNGVLIGFATMSKDNVNV